MNPAEQERQRQRDEGLRLTMGNDSRVGAKPKGPFIPNPSKPDKDIHPPRTHKGHESLLQKLLNTREPITITTNDRVNINGTVVAFDAFTITLQTTPEMRSDTPKRMLMFKHAIRSILLPESFVTGARA